MIAAASAKILGETAWYLIENERLHTVTLWGWKGIFDEGARAKG